MIDLLRRSGSHFHALRLYISYPFFLFGLDSVHQHILDPVLVACIFGLSSYLRESAK